MTLLDPALRRGSGPGRLPAWVGGLTRRVGLVPLVGGLVAAIVAIGALGVVVTRGSAPMRTITAVFAQAPGLYAGNHVEVLSIPVGSVTSVKPGVNGVVVTMKVKRSVSIPAGASAVLMAPQVVNDRFVALTPVYNGGPTMADHAVIPTNRTVIPMSIDQVLGTLDSLFKALGPTAADQQGVLASLLNELNSQLNGQGQPLHDTIAAAASAATGLAADAPQLAGTLDKLSSFVKTLANDSSNYELFTSTLAGAASQLNGEKTQLAGALSTLQQTLAQVANFVKTNGTTIGATIRNLDAAAAATASQQASLGQALQLLPLAGQNLQNAVGLDMTDPAHPTPILQARVTVPTASQGLVKQVCGSTLLRTVQLFTMQSAAPVLAPICSFSAAATALNAAPGTPAAPDLSLAALMDASK
ncbi:MCE family protein [Acidiferrimicrobium sp. IK]|uniref:MCE family protein n=1 Tax=Acidiferrimicrobium sp. IK TaxID=2871700 RepID=UPI0021CAEB24|nr:MCE family protein [Acidiferrimicrobium sp. IK]MCU4186139.1 MCE family protein [Acidiferrimicrobium sp. IK]